MKKLFMAAVVFMMVSIPIPGFAGDIDSPGAPSAGSGMYTLMQLYDYLNSGTLPTIPAYFQEPAEPPGSTMQTTTNIYDNMKAKFDQCDAQSSDVAAGKKFFSTQSGSSWGVQTGTGAGGGSTAVPKTGQTTSYATGDDGDLEEGVAWPNPRFTDNDNGTVTDKLTGLMWAKNANLTGGPLNWENALTSCNNLALGGYSDWRLPNVKELHSLIDFEFFEPALSAGGSPFMNVKAGDVDYYWSSTTDASDPVARAWIVNICHGEVTYGQKAVPYYVWPVTSGT